MVHDWGASTCQQAVFNQPTDGTTALRLDRCPGQACVCNMYNALGEEFRSNNATNVIIDSSSGKRDTKWAMTIEEMEY